MNILKLLTNFMPKKGSKKDTSTNSLIKELIDNPDNFSLQADVEGDEIIITFTKKYNKSTKREETMKKDLSSKIREVNRKLRGED